MKPDGVATVALEPMETPESNPGNEGASAVGQEQTASPAEEEMPQQPVAESGQGGLQSQQAKEPPAAKTNHKTLGDKSKTTNKATAKPKPSPGSTTKTTPGSRSNTTPSRLSNGVSKPQSNGLAKKGTPAPEKKSTPTPAKKPPAPISKEGEKKATGAATASNGAKPPSTTTAAKKTPSATGVKTSSTAAAARKPPAPRPASATPTKPGSAASPKPDKPAASKTASRPTTGLTASPRPPTGSARPPTATKSSPAAPKAATTKASSAGTKPAASKASSTTPSSGKAPASQASRNSTPVKKDVTKPGAKKPSESPLTRPPSTTKSAKPETPKSTSNAAAKKPPANKAADTKTPIRSKAPDTKAAPSKAPASKTAPAKKTVGSSTPTPVKRAPKTAAEPVKDIAATVAAAAAIATAATVIAGLEEPEPAAAAPQAVSEPTPESVPVPAIQLVQTPEPVRGFTPEPVYEPTPESVREPTPEPVREPTPEPVREPTPEPMQRLTPEPVRETTPEPVREPTPEPVRGFTPEPIREPTPEPVREPTPEPVREPTPEPIREPTPEPMQRLTPEPVRETTPEPRRNLTPEPDHELSPDHLKQTSPELPAESVEADLFSSVPLSAQLELFKLDESAKDSVPPLGTTVMSPPCSPPCPVSPVREPQSDRDTEMKPDPWDQNQLLATSQHTDHFLMEENKEHFEAQETGEEEDEEEEENLFSSSAPSAAAHNLMAQPDLLGGSLIDKFTPRDLFSPQEEAVEKADEEINEDDDDDDDDGEDEDDEEEQRRLGHQPSSIITDMSMSQPSEEFQVRSSGFGGSAGWPGDDLLSGMDSEDVSSCTSSRQQGVSDLSSTQHTAILEGTQSSDALIDSSLRGSEGDGNLMGSPNVETLANEDEEEEEEERVDDMDLSSERVEEHHMTFQQQKHEEEEDEDVEMHSEGVNVDEDDFNEDERLDDLSGSVPPAPASSWGQTNPFCDTWAQPASPSPVSDHGAAESETPTQSPAQPCLDSTAPSFTLQSQQEFHTSAPEEVNILLPPPAVGVSQTSTALAARSSSETSTPEELRDYDSSSGVESRSEKQHTPVPASVQADVDQDLGIHLEKGDGEEEEAETLPADEILGTGPPTAPASAPSSPSTSGDEASDTEGEMQINDPDAPMPMDKTAGFESPPSGCNMPALEEDEEAADAQGGEGEGEEDGGGVTPQSANSVASYGFDCTTSNSNAHSMAESCGKSPGIFSLENEEQLPEEAKDPSLIKELTVPPAAAAAQAEERLGLPVDLMPLGHPADVYPSLEEHHCMLPAEEVGALGAEESADASQPPYYSTMRDKTDSFLAGELKNKADEGLKLQTRSQEDNQNQNHTVPIANGHYLAMVPGNRRPIDPNLAAHFANIAPPPPLLDGRPGGEQLRRLERHQENLLEMQHRQEQERQKRQWLEEERLRLEQQKQLERQRRELLQLQLQQQQQEHRHRRQVLQWQLELEQQYRMQQKQIQQQQQLRRSPTGVMLSPSSGLCTIYEAMETSDEEDEARGEQNRNVQVVGRRLVSAQRQLHPVPTQELAWNKKVDMVQQLINQTLMLSGDGRCPPLLLLPVGSGGTLSPLESSTWPHLLPQFRPPDATVTSVSSFSPDGRGSAPPGDWTVVEVETQH